MANNRLVHQINNRFESKLALLAVTLLSLVGCQNDDMADLKEFVATAYQDQRPEIEPLPEIQPYLDFEYSSSSDADPFSFNNIVTSRPDGSGIAGSGPDSNRRREPLEQFPLDALKMVGTMMKDQRPWVVVQTSEGTVHRATVGNYMGQNDGKIKRILPAEQKVVLAELIPDSSGRWVSQETEITIDE